MYKYYLLLVILLAPIVSISQIKDTVRIDEVTITAPEVKYMVGAKKQSFDEYVVKRLGHLSLAETITRYTPIYIKQNAGGLSTIHFRGTTADHTAIMFGDINLNSLTLGHSNMANIPMFLFDQVDVQFGSSSSLYGTDAIGGTIHLDIEPKLDGKQRLFLQQDIASFGSYFFGEKITFGTTRFENSLRFYYYEAENDFPFTGIWDFEQKEFIQDTQKNTAIQNYGVLNQMYFKPADKHLLGFRIWYDFNWHEIQPNESANYNGTDFKEIEEKHIRSTLSYSYKGENEQLDGSVNYVRDYQLYANNENEIIATNRAIAKVEYENKKVWNGNLKVGTRLAHIVPDVYAYDKDLSESRVEFYLHYNKRFFNRLNASLNLREIWVSDYSSRFTPSVSLNYFLARVGNSVIKLKGSFSESYKIPTFNDRYWNPGGNPDLLSENGHNFEFGVQLQGENDVLEYKIESSVYYLVVDNWIQWLNIDIWRPQNIKTVHSRGVELNSNFKLFLEKGEVNFGANYSFNRATTKESYKKDDAKIGEQLMYAPIHTANVFGTYKIKGFSFSIDGLLTGWRYNEGSEILDGYFLTNSELSYSFPINQSSISLGFSVNNIANVDYQNQHHFAMPGRNYRLSMKLTFN